MPDVQQFFDALPAFLGFVALEFFILQRQRRACSGQKGATQRSD
jgi:hypothetical protein